MLKFFRKIRQKMLSENKFSKYLLYAIGEIILVMIGILLALQVNNWNENRKAQKSEINILSQLKTDLNENLLEIKSIKNELLIANNATDELLYFLNSNNNELDSIPIKIEQIDSNPIFNNANTTYKNIENNNQTIISDDSLRIRVTLMYETDFKNIHFRENLFLTNYYPLFRQELRVNFKSSSRISEKYGNVYDNYLPINLSQLKQNNVFINTLSEMYNFRKIRLKFLSLSINNLEKLIMDIDNELKK
jgi:hypothetical protein